MRVYEFPFDNRIGKHSDLPIVNAIYTYENPNTFRTIILKIKHVIYIKDKKALLCPNQACDYGTIIYNIPPHLDHTGTGTFTTTDGDNDLPLEQYGPALYINLRRL